MEFVIAVRELNELLKRTKNKNEELAQSIRYKNIETRTRIPLETFGAGELKVLSKVLDDRIKAEPLDRDSKWARNRLTAYFDLLEGPITSETKVKRHEALVIALKRYLSDHAPHRWLFREESDDGMFLPYFVSEIQYTKRRRGRDGEIYPAYVTLVGTAYKNGHRTTTSVTWSEDSFAPQTVPELLKAKKLIVETKASVSEYQKELDHYGLLQDACGLQMYAIGEAHIASYDTWRRSWSSSSMIRNGLATRVVVDPTTPEMANSHGDSMRSSDSKIWKEIPDRNGLTIDNDVPMENDDDDADPSEANTTVMLPLHPYLYCFDLEKHQWVNIHSSNLQDYPWDKGLLTKLILPEEQKKLIQILISTTHGQVGDIVRGKMSGIIVLATGKPGTGKTLTAEVFSEFIEKPLYTVQCSQLGLDVDAIEKNLQEILQRASRWGAVLLIDEADVYIRRRGEDITQNAIVGVFLRLLEYYRGVLFMTSNRGDVIDDAILSRATAWVKYELPNAKLLIQIWEVLSKQYSVELTDQDVFRLIRDLPSLSGRSVRNILKLASLLHGKQATADSCRQVSKYQAIENESQ
jgi:ATPase family associated with various cellular activities (AAA)